MCYCFLEGGGRLENLQEQARKRSTAITDMENRIKILEHSLKKLATSNERIERIEQLRKTNSEATTEAIYHNISLLNTKIGKMAEKLSTMEQMGETNSKATTKSIVTNLTLLNTKMAEMAKNIQTLEKRLLQNTKDIAYNKTGILTVGTRVQGPWHVPTEEDSIKSESTETMGTYVDDSVNENNNTSNFRTARQPDDKKFLKKNLEKFMKRIFGKNKKPSTTI